MIDEILDQIFFIYDHFFCSGQFDHVDFLLTQYPLERFETTRLVGILAASFPGREHLKSRDETYRKIEGILVSRHGERKAEELLWGLK